MTTDDDSPALQKWLHSFIAHFGGVSGTVHLRANQDELHLAASHNIPPKVLDVVRVIPLGKGMAGLAWQRDAAVSTCNLKTDSTGDVRPGARAVDAQAAVALPIHQAGQVAGVVGIAFADERSLSDEDLQELAQSAEQAPCAPGAVAPS